MTVLKRSLFATLAFSFVACVAACDSAGDGDGDGDGGGDAELVGDFEGLPQLGADFVYEGWLIVDGSPTSTGRFTVDAQGAPTPATWSVSADDVEGASAFVLSIEPAEDDDPAPTDVHVLGGDWDADGSDLSIGHATALGTDFSDASGTYFLQTPTSAGVDDDFDQGIWFLLPADGVPSLDLPELPAGWAYEGWVVGDDGPISTGTFASPTGADSDGPGPDAGPDGFPGFPGQDFIDPAQSLVGHAVVISVEPVPDDSPAPFQIKPLMDPEAEDLAPPTQQDLGLVIDENTISGRVDVN